MQPTTKPRLDCLEYVGQRILGIALRAGLGGFVFPEVNGGQGFSFRRGGANLPGGELPVRRVEGR
jgi:hypothetical protein